MTHLQPEQLQGYLADALAPSARAALADHLAECPQCSEALAALVADDAFLTGALDLSMPETAWIESQDLTANVLQQLPPRVAVNPSWIIAVLVGLPGLWIFGLLDEMALRWLAGRATIGGLVDVGQSTLPALYRFTVWWENGGLLIRLWPLFVLGAAVWLWRLSHIKETDVYA